MFMLISNKPIKVADLQKLANQLTLPAQPILGSCVRIKINISFYFQTSLWCLQRLKGFIKPFEAPQRSVKIKIEVNFFFSFVIGA